MASFNNDIFISYAHADNRDGWVDAFHTSLENRLGVLGVEARIWRDKKLSGADVFSDQILDQLKQSALLISILSPNAMRSNWCEKERQKFEQYAEASGGFRIGNLVRALKVVMTPADRDAHQPIFGTIGYEFFEKNRQTGRYDHYFRQDARFEKLIDGLAQEIKAFLQTLASAAPQPDKPAVYVAEVSSDLEPDRARVVDQLRAWGYRVAPSGPLPIHAPGLRAAIGSALGEAVLSVHLLSDKRGAIPDEEDKSILALQYELANARALERVVWVLPDTQPHSSVDAVIQAGSVHGLERLEGQKTIEDLKEILAAKLNRLDERARGTSNGGPKLNIYVVCHRRDHPFCDEAEDRDDALKLKLFLDGRGYCVWLPPVNVTDPRECDKDHRETLKLSDAVILYWGAADEAWFRRTLRELTKARSTTRRNRPFAAEAIYFSRPPCDEKGQYRTHLDLALEQFQGFQPEAMRPFLDRLRQTKGVPDP
jgi:TIR domain